MDFKKDYYAILGVSQSATKAEIKSAYRHLARKHHPDKNPDDLHADDRFKEINQANEVLSNDISRAVYDQYISKEKQLNAEKLKVSQPGNNKKKKTYTKTTVVEKEQRIYIRGEITVKYWAEEDLNFALFSSWATDYQITPVEVCVKILQSDIFNYPGTPINFEKAFTAAEIFRVPLQQPVNCSVSIAGAEEYYQLNLLDVRIREPIIIDVMKHEGQSLATLKGELYAYTLMVVQQTVTEEVTEFSGETGAVETKSNGNTPFVRKEYFYPDGSTYWGPWEKKSHRGEQRNALKRQPKRSKAVSVQSTGCAGYWWVLPVMICGFIFPHITLGILVIIFLVWLLGLFSNVLRDLRGFFIGLCILFFSFLFYDVFQGNRLGRNTIVFPKNGNDSIVTQERLVKSGASTIPDDQLISHFIRWRDYDTASYTIILSILRSEVEMSTSIHENMLQTSENSLAPIYTKLIESDSPKMSKVYMAFDSVRQARHLDETAFANAVVSCVQSIPYFLVLDNSCEAENYHNSFITQYLEQCKRDCCIGYARFGIRSPAEFIGDLKGDCDTRAMVIYSILKNFDYNVALLTSVYYQHSVIAVALPGTFPASSVAIPIRGKNYLMWETTQTGFQAGEIPEAYQDLDKWSVDLLHEKNSL